jgi:hypothetical protein
MKHLAKQGFMLIVGKAIHQEFTEFSPSKLARLLQGLDLAFRCPIEMHARHLDPEISWNPIHLKVILGLGNPELGGFAIIGWEIEFRQAWVTIDSLGT